MEAQARVHASVAASHKQSPSPLLDVASEKRAAQFMTHLLLTSRSQRPSLRHSSGLVMALQRLKHFPVVGWKMHVVSPTQSACETYLEHLSLHAPFETVQSASAAHWTSCVEL